MSTEIRNFNLAHILSITTDILCPLAKNKDYPIRTVREILNFMANDPHGIQTFSLSRVANECRPYLLEQFPQLAHINETHLLLGDINVNMEILIEKYGDSFDVYPIHHEDHQIIDPQVEMAMLAPNVELFTINIDEEDEEQE